MLNKKELGQYQPKGGNKTVEKNFGKIYSNNIYHGQYVAGF
jgi:hypothetical protein